jgi:Fic family protein
MIKKLPVSPETLRAVAAVDHFRGAWTHGTPVPAERLERLRDAARIQSVGASCRLAGIHVTDAEVAAILHREPVPVQEGPEVLGYAEALDLSFPSGPRITVAEIQALHARALGVPGEPPPPTAWRDVPYHLEIFDEKGRALGRVFQTLPPRLLNEKMEELVDWLEAEIQGDRNHPILVTGTFVLYFIAACPFPKGNGRMAHLLVQHILRRAGYDFVPYASVERILEEMRADYFDALDAAETRLWSGEADIERWLVFYLHVLETHCEMLQSKLDLERRALEFTPLQRKILETVREHGTVGAGLLIEATGANRNTLKDNLRRMVGRGVLERLGERRGARYRLPTGETAVSLAASIPGSDLSDV